jgi:hypothetical protein
LKAGKMAGNGEYGDETAGLRGNAKSSLARGSHRKKMPQTNLVCGIFA